MQLENNSCNGFRIQEYKLKNQIFNTAISFYDFFNNKKDVLFYVIPCVISETLDYLGYDGNISDCFFDWMSLYTNNEELMNYIKYCLDDKKITNKNKLLEVQKKFVIKGLTKDAINKELKGEQCI